MHVLEFLWSLAAITVLVGYFLVLYRVIDDIVRDPGLSGVVKAVWVVLLVVVPVVPLLVYFVARRRDPGQAPSRSIQ